MKTGVYRDRICLHQEDSKSLMKLNNFRLSMQKSKKKETSKRKKLKIFECRLKTNTKTYWSTKSGLKSGKKIKELEMVNS